MLRNLVKGTQKGRPQKWVSAAVLLASLFTTITLSLAQRIPEDVKSSVAFVLAPQPNGSLGPIGTGFFIEIKNPKTNLSALYFVTNKHVLSRTKGSSDFRPTLDIRLNAKDGNITRTFSTNLIAQGMDRNVYIHSDDPSVDLVVIPVAPDRGKYEFTALSVDLITTKDQYRSLEIAEGSEVFFTGLFHQFTGERRNYPIVRFGRVALVTDERIPVSKDQAADLYLIESGVYGGNSGSPVFFFLSSDGTPGRLRVNQPRVLKLAGIIQGNFGDVEPIVGVETALVPMARANVGIAFVVPAYKLHEILFGSELRAVRKW